MGYSPWSQDEVIIQLQNWKNDGFTKKPLLKPKINLSIKKDKPIYGIDLGGKTDNLCIIEMDGRKIKFYLTKININTNLYHSGQEIESNGFIEN